MNNVTLKDLEAYRYIQKVLVCNDKIVRAYPLKIVYKNSKYVVVTNASDKIPICIALSGISKNIMEVSATGNFEKYVLEALDEKNFEIINKERIYYNKMKKMNGNISMIERDIKHAYWKIADLRESTESIQPTEKAINILQEIDSLIASLEAAERSVTKIRNMLNPNMEKGSLA